jgi:hypothetical protein
MVPAWSLPVLVLAARTFWPVLSLLIGTSAPEAVSTLVPAVKLSPPHEGPVVSVPARAAAPVSAAWARPVQENLPVWAAVMA